MTSARLNRVEDHLGLIRKLATRYTWACRDGLEFEDLVSVAVTHICERQHHFDPSRGAFTTFVRKCALLALWDYCNKYAGVVKKPRQADLISDRVKGLRHTMFRIRVPHLPGSPDSDVFDYLVRDVSRSSGAQFVPHVASDYDLSADWDPENIDKKKQAAWLMRAIKRLPVRYRQALLAAEPGEKQRIATENGITRQAVDSWRWKGLYALKVSARKAGLMEVRKPRKRRKGRKPRKRKHT